MSALEEATQSWWMRAGTALGFHVPVVAFALRTAFAAFVALLIAYAVGLEHPHWAAMSAWASSQPRAVFIVLVARWSEWFLPLR